jgi:hypothetical protein
MTYRDVPLDDWKRNAPPELAGFSLDEDGVALAFAARHKDELRYCHSTGKWFHWDGTRWLNEETELAFSWARALTPVAGSSPDAEGACSQ